MVILMAIYIELPKAPKNINTFTKKNLKNFLNIYLYNIIFKILKL